MHHDANCFDGRSLAHLKRSLDPLDGDHQEDARGHAYEPFHKTNGIKSCEQRCQTLQGVLMYSKNSSWQHFYIMSGHVS